MLTVAVRCSLQAIYRVLANVPERDARHSWLLQFVPSIMLALSGRVMYVGALCGLIC